MLTIGSKLSAILLVILFTGCSFNCKPCVNVCPIGVIPSPLVLEKIGGLADTDVNQWMKNQYKLHKKLKACNTK